MFKECYAMEKIHGTSSHISWNNDTIRFFSGGEKHENFVKLFDKESLIGKFIDLNLLQPTTIFREACGGKQQGMSHTYGKELKFVAFDVKIGEHCWLSVPQAQEIVKNLGLDFVWYTKITTDIGTLDQVRNRWSEQAIRNGIMEKKIMEGIVLRPLIEVRKNNGARIIAKYKREEFRETLKKRKVLTPDKQKIWKEAKETSKEWVTFNRLKNILSHIGKEVSIEDTGNIIKIMIDDIKREASNEVIWNKEIQGAIGKATAKLFKAYITDKLHNE